MWDFLRASLKSCCVSSVTLFITIQHTTTVGDVARYVIHLHTMQITHIHSHAHRVLDKRALSKAGHKTVLGFDTSAVQVQKKKRKKKKERGNCLASQEE